MLLFLWAIALWTAVAFWLAFFIGPLINTPDDDEL